MRVRSDVVAMLRQGIPQQDIMRTLRVGHQTVVTARDALQMPAPVRGRRAPRPIDTEFYARTEPVDGGHLRWTGHYAEGSPKLGRQGGHLSAYRIAFKLRHDREPVGKATPGCGYPKCVAPDHVEDQPMRAQLRQQMAGIFGGAQ
ncbi:MULTISPECIES: hypothetical protein [unclassified Streptomyces]|uniref:hypothetical protein n=1 Tax=unclassified Streptomyces TaxID=2593676 RepID=UPI000978EECF|nr:MULTISPECIES: hypothetical protein [unclassified Streptomyces]ONI48665.1 hypothetical protein STIB_72190 [Streptomyces sp. IB2014 011-1]RDV48195.1 hypothetical protein DDV98_28935 [Streptomyces sp. IB2014 011-12]